jgi:hypothetical protein
MATSLEQELAKSIKIREKLEKNIKALEDALTLSEALRVTAEDNIAKLLNEMNELYVAVDLRDDDTLEFEFAGCRLPGNVLGPPNYGFIKKGHYELAKAIQ